MANERVTLSRVRAKRKVDGFAPTHVKRAPGNAPQVVTAHPVGLEESVQGHEQRSREVRLEVGKTLDETRKQNATKRAFNETGPAALFLQERVATSRTSNVVTTDDPARDDVRVMLRALHKETRVHPARILVDVLLRGLHDGVKTYELESALGVLKRAFLQDDDLHSLLSDPALMTALRAAPAGDPYDLMCAVRDTPASVVPQLVALLDGPDFRQSSVDGQLRTLTAFRTRVALPPEAQANLERFLASEAFCVLPGEVQMMMLKVVRETDGHAIIIDGLIRAAGSQSFGKMEVACQMTFTGVVGETLSLIRSGTESQRRVLRNSLERILEPNGIPVVLKALAGASGMAKVESRHIILNSDYRLSNERDIRHLGTHTLAHEINHILNEPNEVAPMYEHFMGEYRAWCVGFVAEHGRWPSRHDGAARVTDLLDLQFSYAFIARAAGGSNADGEAIRRFAAQFTDAPLDPKSPDCVHMLSMLGRQGGPRITNPDEWSSRTIAVPGWGRRPLRRREGARLAHAGT